MRCESCHSRGMIIGVLAMAAAGAAAAFWLKSESTVSGPIGEPVEAPPITIKQFPPARVPAVASHSEAPAAGSQEVSLKLKAPEQTAANSDHIMFGGTHSRNMVNLVDKGIPDKPDPEGAGVLWHADLGSRAYGGPTIAGKKVYVGTNNERPRNPRDTRKNADGDVEPIDKGVMMCFEEGSGNFLWQAIHDKLAAANVHDWPKEGLCSTPSVDGDRVYYVSNRCTIVCAGTNGLAGPRLGKIDREKFKDKTDVDIIWEYDMMGKDGVFPHNMAAGCPLIVGNLLYTVTANGVDEGHLNIPAPNAPSFVALDKMTGQLVWSSNIPGKNIMHGQWSNPCYGEIKGVKQVIFPGGDGYLYGFEPTKGELLWKCDLNPKDSVYKLGGEGTRNDFVGTPVIYKEKVYIGLGQDPEHFTGIGHFWCIDPSKATKPGDDISPEIGEWGKPGKPNPNSGIVWHYGGPDDRSNAPRNFVFGRTMSTACIVDDILYISELQGQLHCLNAITGARYWMYDTKGALWGSPYYVDGKVFLATEGGDLFVFKHFKEPKVIPDPEFPKLGDQKKLRAAILENRAAVEKEYLVHKQEFDAPIRSTPVVANGVLYVMTEKSLFALGNKK